MCVLLVQDPGFLRSGQTEVKMTNLILASLPRDMAAIGSTKCTYTPTNQ